MSERIGDHPRVCGEQIAFITLVIVFLGSPPRVRGTVYKLKPAIYSLRITPACAGNRTITTVIMSTSSDHPRVCGEQEYGRRKWRSVLGSPPRVRGTAIMRRYGREFVRITPACAGNRTAN